MSLLTLLIYIVVTLVVVGVLLWALGQFADYVDPAIMKLIRVVVVVGAVLWLLVLVLRSLPGGLNALGAG